MDPQIQFLQTQRTEAFNAFQTAAQELADAVANQAEPEVTVEMIQGFEAIRDQAQARLATATNALNETLRLRQLMNPVAPPAPIFNVTAPAAQAPVPAPGPVRLNRVPSDLPYFCQPSFTNNINEPLPFLTTCFAKLEKEGTEIWRWSKAINAQLTLDDMQYMQRVCNALILENETHPGPPPPGSAPGALGAVVHLTLAIFHVEYRDKFLDHFISPARKDVWRNEYQSKSQLSLKLSTMAYNNWFSSRVIQLGIRDDNLEVIGTYKRLVLPAIGVRLGEWVINNPGQTLNSLRTTMDLALSYDRNHTYAGPRGLGSSNPPRDSPNEGNNAPHGGSNGSRGGRGNGRGGRGGSSSRGNHGSGRGGRSQTHNNGAAPHGNLSTSSLPCRICEGNGVNVIWSWDHMRSEHLKRNHDDDKSATHADQKTKKPKSGPSANHTEVEEDHDSNLIDLFNQQFGHEDPEANHLDSYGLLEEDYDMDLNHVEMTASPSFNREVEISLLDVDTDVDNDICNKSDSLYLCSTIEINNVDNNLVEESNESFRTPVKINGVLTEALVDSGASHSFIDLRFARKLNLDIQVKNGTTFRAGKPEKRIGSVSVRVENGSKTLELHMEVLDHGRIDVLFGRRDFKQLGYSISGIPVKPPGPEVRDINDDIIPIDYEDPAQPFESLHPRLQEAITRNQQIRIHDPCTHPLAICPLDTIDGKIPVLWNDRNFVKPQDEAGMDANIESWIRDGIVKPAVNPTTCFSLLNVPKTDSNGYVYGLRSCLDFSPANPYLKPVSYPMPLIDDVLSYPMAARGPKSVRTKIDLKGAFTRFGLIKSWANFKWRNKIWTFNNAFFGISIMPALYQMMIDAISRELNDIFKAYIDDIFTKATESFEEDLNNTILIIDTLTKYGIIISPEKSIFQQWRIPGLGFLIDGNGKHIHPSKIKAIVNWKPPTRGVEMASFLGTVGWNRAHLPKYAMIS